MKLLNKILDQQDSDKKILMLAIYRATYEEVINILIDESNNENYEKILMKILTKKDLINSKLKQY